MDKEKNMIIEIYKFLDEIVKWVCLKKKKGEAMHDIEEISF